MNYIFKGKNGYFRADIWENHVNAIVSVYDEEHNKQKKEVLKDDMGWFFFHKEEKFYIFDWVRLSIYETIEKLKTEQITSDMLCQSILSEGISNVKFLVSVNENGNLLKRFMKKKDKKVVCHIEERENRTVKQNFRIILISDHSEKNSIEKDISTEELLHMIKDGSIKVLAA